MITITNLTPHPLTLRSATGQDTVLPPSGTIARVSATPGAVEDREGFPVPVALPDTFGAVEGQGSPLPGEKSSSSSPVS